MISIPRAAPLLLAAVTAAAAAWLGAPAEGQQPPPPGDLEAEEARRPVEPMPVPRTLVKHRGQRPIHVDGSLQDWPSAPPLQLDDPRQLSGTALGAWRGADDLLGRVFLLWDADDLFVAAVVRDDWHRPLTGTSPRVLEIPPADSILLTFDPRRDTRSMGADPGREEDREFWLADVEGQGRKLVLWDRFRGTARFATGAVAVVKREDESGLTTYEARIPWHEVLPGDMRPEKGLVIDLQVVINDYDEITDPVPQTRLGWTFGASSRIDPGLLGSIMLTGDLEKQVEALPEFPPPPARAAEPVPGPAHWVRFAEALGRTPPVAVESDAMAPRAALGEDRLRNLLELEGRFAAFPRVDSLDYHFRVHRRMRRECAGMVATGLPYFWQHVLADVGRRASEVPGETGFRLFRLPVGGWLVRSRVANFGIDPAGYDLEHHVWGALDFVLLTYPGELTKRNDQVLVRMAAAQRPFYTHLSFHLPGLDAQKIPLVKVGQDYGTAGVRVRLLGPTSEELLAPTVGYLVEWPDGTVLVHTGQSVSEEDLLGALPAARPVDLLLLSCKHPQAARIGRAVRARLIVFDDVLQCAMRAGSEGRVPLEDVFALQTELRPAASVIVAPGESIDVAPR